MKRKTTYLALLVLLLAGCKDTVTDTAGEPRLKATGMPELPYILEGDYTPDTGVMYKVIVDNKTCFVVVDSISDNRLYGYYYQIVKDSDYVERKSFEQDAHWQKQRREALVYLYRQPDYTAANDTLYRLPQYKVRCVKDVEYGQALGYWCSMNVPDDESLIETLSNGVLNSIVRTTQSLKMDIYQPDIENIEDFKMPLLVLMHGGGFYVGDKDDKLMEELCSHFAALGYVAVSINYRLGFLPTRSEIARTGYIALQDAHAAVRYLVDHATQYGIDTSLIFAGGASAGSITALNLAFMRDKDRPKSLEKKSWRELGAISGSGNSSHATFSIKAVVNMWGAVTNLNMLKNSNTNIISFHGDADGVVPYDIGYPFSEASRRIGKRLFDQMYGSKQIDQRARELGRESLLYTFPSEGHSLHHNADGSWNSKNYKKIESRTTDFLYRQIAGEQPVIERDSVDRCRYYVSDASKVRWRVDGGFIIGLDTLKSEIRVVWDNGEPQHRLYASGLNAKGFGFNTLLDIKQ